MRLSLSAFFVGTLFGLGLAVAEMTNPARVVGFLDVAGRWDATLLLVMAGALAITLPLFPLIVRRPAPLLASSFDLPRRKDIDRSLLAGAAIFGVGWGMAGLCPGPALAALVTVSPSVILFVAAMFFGQWLVSRIQGRVV